MAVRTATPQSTAAHSAQSSGRPRDIALLRADESEALRLPADQLAAAMTLVQRAELCGFVRGCFDEIDQHPE
jgi:hypothetical protein